MSHEKEESGVDLRLVTGAGLLAIAVLIAVSKLEDQHLDAMCGQNRSQCKVTEVLFCAPPAFCDNVPVFSTMTPTPEHVQNK